MDGDESSNENFSLQIDENIKTRLRSVVHTNREYVCTTNRLGKGAYSKVYKGYIVGNERDEEQVWVAIKRMNLTQLRSHDFLDNEIEIMKQLNHPNIINMIDVIHQSENDERILYLILELCSGGDLKKMVRNRKMKEKYAIAYFKQIANGLQYLRSKNIIHRDLKPHNVLITSDKKTLKIADFGFAKIIGSETLAETICGSPLYMAPEILLKKPYTSKADLWSVGVMLYEVLCATHPFKNIGSIIDLVHKVENDEIQFPSTVTISPLGIDLLKRLLKKDPHHRIGWDEFFNHKWFKLIKDDDQSLSLSVSLSQSDIITALPYKGKVISSPLPIIQNYAPPPPGNNRILAMSPPSFINSPMYPVDVEKSVSKIKVIDNYESSELSRNNRSMPLMPFESSNENESNESISKKKKNGLGEYLGTSFKMLKDSFQSQSLH